jgi:thioredoxin 1
MELTGPGREVLAILMQSWRQAEIEALKAVVGIFKQPTKLLAGMPLFANGAVGTPAHPGGAIPGGMNSPRGFPAVLGVTIVTDATFTSQVLNSHLPVLVAFDASWCVPCKYASPWLKDKARDTPMFRIVKIDVDEYADFVLQFDVAAMPTFVIFKGGREVARKVGFVPNEINLLIAKYLHST